jgi:prepilin-type N-terminal cleavage/methylation domain-containing protein
MMPVDLRSLRRFRRSRLGSGFSLLELMVALGVGAIAITSIYAVGASTTRQFQRQEQLAGTQTSMRFAMNQLKRDIARAGYLSTPNVAVTPMCGATPSSLNTANVRLAAFSQFVNNETDPATAVEPNAENDNLTEFTADRISLIGNYETTAEYAGIELVDPKTIAVPMDWHAFRRDFTDWYDGDGDYQHALFAEVFKVGRMIRIQTTERKRHFAVITGVVEPAAGERPKIGFEPEVPDLCKSAVNNGWVAPVSVIELSVRDKADDTITAEAMGPVGQLMRREMKPGVDERDETLVMTIDADPLNDAVDNANSRSILDLVVAFNLQFTLNAAGAGLGTADNYQVGVTTDTDNGIADAPERIRSVLIDVAVRAPFQDSSRGWVEGSCEGMRCFRVFTGRPGSAPVRRMRTEVFVPNVAYEGY